MTVTLWLQGVYILTSVFALGVTAIESMGLLGDDDGDPGDGDDGAAADSGSDGHASDANGDGEDAADDASGRAGVATRGGGWQQRSTAGHYLFKALAALRLAVYFSLGFGPMGLVAMLLGSGTLLSLGLAIPAGLLSGVLYRSLIRFQRRELDSTVTDRDLIGARASVLIAIYPNETGRVRVTLAQLVCDRYAVSDSNDFIPKGALVDVLAATDHGLVVAMPHEHV